MLALSDGSGSAFLPHQWMSLSHLFSFPLFALSSTFCLLFVLLFVLSSASFSSSLSSDFIHLPNILYVLSRLWVLWRRLPPTQEEALGLESHFLPLHSHLISFSSFSFSYLFLHSHTHIFPHSHLISFCVLILTSLSSFSFSFLPFQFASSLWSFSYSFLQTDRLQRSQLYYGFDGSISLLIQRKK